jgi:MoaA/NifB/PqqE/SkfB family radical SAM enzyme
VTAGSRRMRPSSDTLLVWVGGSCSYGCSACPIDPRSAPDGVQAAELERSLTGLPPALSGLVVLVGGEPFLRPDLPRLLAVIRAAGRVPGPELSPPAAHSSTRTCETCSGVPGSVT